MWWRIIVCFCIAVRVTAEDGTSRVVQLSQGPVRGYKDQDGDMFIFYGIPYATAPTGPNKFKPPLPPPTWKEPLEAIDRGIVCPQARFDIIIAINKTMQEDCLIANIFVPDTTDTNLPVLVIVHGGAFQIGYGNLMLPKNLIRTRKMVVVTFNYRLGVHGFLCLGTKDVPGNAGMKDQVALLRWVKNNIAAFGGNAGDISLSGGSAGGASVDLLMLSKSTKGLFNKVSAESGSSLAAFSIQSDPVENAKQFAKRLNFRNTDDIYALQESYRRTSLELLTIDSFINRTDSTFFFSPCVEHNIEEEVFLDEDPIKILKKGNYEKVPLLIGFANMEGLFRIDNFEQWKIEMNENFSDFLAADLKFENDEEKQEVANKIKEFYFREEPVSSENVLTYINYFSDVIFSVPALRSVKYHIDNGHSEVYLYEYSFTHDADPPIPYPNIRGANHCTQTMAFMDGLNIFQQTETNISVEYKNMKSLMRELWSNFITTGKPVPVGSTLPPWPSVVSNWTPYMSLGQKLELKSALLEKRVRFWEEIYEKYYYHPIVPTKPTPKVNSEL